MQLHALTFFPKYTRVNGGNVEFVIKKNQVPTTAVAT
jgi:hypothetical protein